MPPGSLALAAVALRVWRGSLSVPFEYDFAVGANNLHLALIRLLGVFSASPAVVANLFYLVSFALSALSAFAVFRWARVSRAVALVCAVLYASRR